MRKTIVAVTLAGTLGLTGAALLTPGIASAQGDENSSSGVSGRVEALKNALQGLVTDGTLDQAQADKVADALAKERRGPGRHRGPGREKKGSQGVKLLPAAIATAIGIEVDELRAEHQAGKTLTQIAEANGVSREVLVQRLVAAVRSQLAEAVAAGRLTQEQADERAAGLQERIGQRVDRAGQEPGARRPGGGAKKPSSAAKSAAPEAN
ncbi:MAG: hypothetical protein ACR2K2_13305 [Mycobacteriales bacterium]